MAMMEGRSRHVFMVLCLVVAMLAPLLGTGPAEAVFPGTNGKIAFELGHAGIVVMDDGATYHQIGYWPRDYVIDGGWGVVFDGMAASDPAWSPDGQRLAFVYGGSNPIPNSVDPCNDGGSGIAVIELTALMSGPPWQANCLVDTPRLDHSPAWSPDGSELAYAANHTGSTRLYAVDLEDGATRVVYNGDASELSWRPDGEWIAFTSQMGNAPYNRAIVVAKADGSDASDRTGYAVEHGSPEYSPDGSRIVFFARTGPWDDQSEIFVMDADGGNLTPLTDSLVSEYGPSWSPDGTRILYTSGDWSFRGLYSMPASGLLGGATPVLLSHQQYTGGAKLMVGASDWQCTECLEPGYFFIDPETDRLCGWMWPEESKVTVTVDGVPHSDILNWGEIVQTDAGGGFCVWEAPPWDADVGDIVTVTVRGASGSHKVLELAVTEVDHEAETVSGTAPAGSPVRVVIDSLSHRPYVYAWADADGVWRADFAGVHDLVPGDHGVAVRDGASHNQTKIHWRIPEITGVSGPTEPVLLGGVVSLTGEFSAPGAFAGHTAEWVWDDATTSVGVVTENWYGGAVTGSHLYTEPGVYTVTLEVTGYHGEVETAKSEFVVVYDPDGGFVTGGGWIDSPAGALTADLEAAGTATFGFVSKYRKRATVPEGNTEFRFRAGDFDFRSISYEWLVVTGSDTAMFKGSGTVGGEVAPSGDPYRFMLWAGDGDADTFRIKIWWEQDGVQVAYDNGSDQELGGGQIVVHATRGR